VWYVVAQVADATTMQPTVSPGGVASAFRVIGYVKSSDKKS